MVGVIVRMIDGVFVCGVRVGMGTYEYENEYGYL